MLWTAGQGRRSASCHTARVSRGGCDLLMFFPARGRSFSFLSFFFVGVLVGFFLFAFCSVRHMTTGPREPSQLCFVQDPGFRELPASPLFGFQVPTRGRGQVQRVRLLDRSWKVPHVCGSGSPSAPLTWLRPLPGEATLFGLIP